MPNQTLYKAMLVFLLAWFSFAVCLGHAQEKQSDSKQQTGSRFEMEEVVVTATRLEDEIRNVPRNVTVITAEDIAQAPSNYVPDLLSREANINLQSFSGTDKQAVVDIRGMGETASSNVLVMVDGFRLNPPDLAGPDFSTIAIDEIERIEIVRGAASVVYGNGAVGGVINIVTKRGKKEPSARLYSTYGSYDTFDGRVSGGGQLQNLNFSVNADYYDTDGYRDNGFLRKKDAGIRLGYDATEYLNEQVFDAVIFSFAAKYHKDKQGFAGGVSIDDIDSRKRRRETNSPDDDGKTKDRRISGGLESDFGRWGVLKINGGYRRRDNDFILGFTSLKSKSEQTSHIDEDDWLGDLSYVQEYNLWRTENTFQFGIDYSYTDYVSERIDQKKRKNSKVENLGFFFTNQTAILDNLSFNTGYRYNIYKGRFRNDDLKDFSGASVWINGDEFDRDYYKNAFDVGAVYDLRDNISIFASFATSFRIPNVDEFAFAADDLKPQKGRHYDLGLRYRFRRLAEFNLTLFLVEIEDEIRFDPDLRVNSNFEDTTRRRGVETALKLYPAENLYIWGNYTYMDAKFEDLDTFVPLVPRHSGGFGFEWQIIEPLLLGFTGTLVTKRYDGNDIDNDTFETLDPYQVYDVKLSYTYRKFKLFGGINNIFDELYSTIAFSESYFPMPTRNYYAGIQWSF
jgi:TonB-dependent siderophore receptor